MKPPQTLGGPGEAPGAAHAARSYMLHAVMELHTGTQHPQIGGDRKPGKWPAPAWPGITSFSVCPLPPHLSLWVPEDRVSLFSQ